MYNGNIRLNYHCYYTTIGLLFHLSLVIYLKIHVPLLRVRLQISSLLPRAFANGIFFQFFERPLFIFAVLAICVYDLRELKF